MYYILGNSHYCFQLLLCYENNLSRSMVIYLCGSCALHVIVLAKHYTSLKQNFATWDKTKQVKQSKISMLHILLLWKCKSEFFSYWTTLPCEIN